MAIDINTAYELWQFDVLTSFNDKTQLVINRKTKRLMIKKIMGKEEFQIHQKLTDINHPNIIKVYDVIRDRHICTVLEQYVAGKTLEQLCSEKPLSEKETKNIILQLCSGLQTLHQNNIIHRDLTPSNIMISDDGIVKIIDFDISRAVKNTSVRDTTMFGTKGFAAPEQFGFGQSNAQTDIYALGVLINYMLTGGKLPNEEMYSGKMSKIIKKCIEIDREKRYKSVDEIMDILSDKQTENFTVADKFVNNIPGFRTSKKSVKVFSAIAYIFVIMLIISCYSIYCHNISDGIYITFMLIFMFVIPVIFLSDFMSFQEYIPFLKNTKKSTRKFIFNFLGIVSIITGFCMCSVLS